MYWDLDYLVGEGVKISNGELSRSVLCLGFLEWIRIFYLSIFCCRRNIIVEGHLLDRKTNRLINATRMEKLEGKKPSSKPPVHVKETLPRLGRSTVSRYFAITLVWCMKCRTHREAEILSFHNSSYARVLVDFAS